jgi:hypothetical protein
MRISSIPILLGSNDYRQQLVDFSLAAVDQWTPGVPKKDRREAIYRSCASPDRLRFGDGRDHIKKNHAVAIAECTRAGEISDLGDVEKNPSSATDLSGLLERWFQVRLLCWGGQSIRCGRKRRTGADRPACRSARRTAAAHRTGRRGARRHIRSWTLGARTGWPASLSPACRRIPAPHRRRAVGQLLDPSHALVATLGDDVRGAVFEREFLPRLVAAHGDDPPGLNAKSDKLDSQSYYTRRPAARVAGRRLARLCSDCLPPDRLLLTSCRLTGRGRSIARLFSA